MSPYPLWPVHRYRIATLGPHYTSTFERIPLPSASPPDRTLHIIECTRSRLRLPFEGPPWRSFPIFVWYLSYFLCDFFLVFRNACFTFVYSSEYNLNGNRCLKSKDNEAGIIQRCDAHSFILSTLKQIYIIKWIYSCQRW